MTTLSGGGRSTADTVFAANALQDEIIGLIATIDDYSMRVSAITAAVRRVGDADIGVTALTMALCAGMPRQSR